MRSYFQKRKARITALVGTIGLLIVFVVVATGGTGAYFSDSHSGTISGTIGSIRVTPSGGGGANNLDFAFTNLLPGEPQSATGQYTNTGANAEDVYIAFNNPTALSALNNLGTYGEVHVTANGNDLFDSANLNDNSTTCGPFSPSGCWPLPSELRLAQNVAPGGTGNFTFTFNYASKLKTQPPAGTTANWNTYPVNGQFTVNSSDGSGSGLPYEIVATQPGQTP
jgi:hypothetical protein